MNKLFDRRERVPAEPRTEILVHIQGGQEFWVDESDYMDSNLVMPCEPYETVADFKKRHRPGRLNTGPY